MGWLVVRMSLLAGRGWGGKGVCRQGSRDLLDGGHSVRKTAIISRKIRRRTPGGILVDGEGLAGGRCKKSGGGGEGAGSEATPSETEDHVQLGGGTGGESQPSDNTRTDKNNSQYGRSHPPLSGNIRNRTTPSNAPIPDGHPCHRHAVVPALSVDLAPSSISSLGASAVPDGPELLLPATPFSASNGESTVGGVGATAA
ncbi:hypothetical protein BC629DRAFT_249678 [Irpex lacteus]|nr:hypothetical protein BC629DRAFT_249678 [Irpex lacteus]